METNLRTPTVLFERSIRYEIPDFQRRYVWKQDEQWEPLWEDIEKLAQTLIDEAKTDAHFMGAVVFQQMEVPSGTIERRIVVDGQQRLTTIQLLIDAIQEVFAEQEHTDNAARLEDLVLNKKHHWGGDQNNAFKVWPTKADREAFRHAMSDDLFSDTYSSSQVVEAHAYFKGQAVQWLSKFEGDLLTRAASALETTIREKLQLARLRLRPTRHGKFAERH